MFTLTFLSLINQATTLASVGVVGRRSMAEPPPPDRR